jgi:hypothetical protein
VVVWFVYKCEREGVLFGVRWEWEGERERAGVSDVFLEWCLVFDGVRGVWEGGRLG